MLLADERAQLVQFGRRMLTDSLTVGTSGNLSVRSGDLVAITPTGAGYETLRPESICVVDLAGNQVAGDLPPSSEVPMHTLIYGSTAAGAVVHTHPLYACTLSVLVDELPAVHYLIALLGGSVRVAPYAPYGTRELAENSVRALDGRCAVLLRSHGATTYGESLARAYSRAVYLEWLCRLYYQARLLGEPHLLSEEEMSTISARIREYENGTP
jgi:L-fuculose-phosphate aldolase